MIWKSTYKTSKYEVSDTGLLRYAATKHIVKVYVQPTNGYARFKYRVGNGKSGGFTVHRAVAMAFLINPYNFPSINHINGIKTDNRVENLEWLTYKENTNHAISKGLWSSKGELNASCKLTEKQVIEIRSKYVPKHYSMYRLAKEYNISPATINNILKRKVWRHI